MLRKIILFTMSCAALLGINSVLACSNAFISGNNYAVAARTMDFPFNTGSKLGYGLKGDTNTSFLNDSTVQGKALSWQNKYNFVGSAFLDGSSIVDGINDAGVYAAYLYLPDFTHYPTYNSHDSRQVLGAQSVVNYVLGMAGSVTEALQLLKQYQMVGSVSSVGKGVGQGLYFSVPCHAVLRDRSGHSAVIEWINGKTIIYDHAGAVLTNGPPYDWQLSNAQRYDYVTAGNINVKYDGAYMNGSGFTGLPGDFSPPSRFARATQVVKNLPKPQNNAEALVLAATAIETMQVPIGSNDSPSLWKSVSDLQNNDYYFFWMYRLTPEYATLSDTNVKISSPALTQSWKKFNVGDVVKVAQANAAKSKLLHVVVTVPPEGTVRKLVNLVDIPTSGPKKINSSSTTGNHKNPKIS